MSDQVGNREDRFSHVVAHIVFSVCDCNGLWFAQVCKVRISKMF